MFAGEKRVTDSRVISRDYAIEITWIHDGGRMDGCTLPRRAAAKLRDALDAALTSAELIEELPPSLQL